MQIKITTNYDKSATNFTTLNIPNIQNTTNTPKTVSNKTDSFQKESYNSSMPLVENYTNKGISYPINSSPTKSISILDKGTAANTTVYVNRSAYDKILHATTFGEMKWEEMGVDGDKRWVVINGQRFECEHSPEEKELRKKMQKSLLDYLEENYENRKSKAKCNGADKPRGNIEALKSNKEVMALLQDIFKQSSPDGVLSQLK